MTPDPSPALPADAAEGSIHMQIVIDFHSARQSGRTPRRGSGSHWHQCDSSKRRRRGVRITVLSGFRSARAEAHGQDPAEAESRSPDHLHPGSGQTQRRQVHDEVRQQQAYMEIRGEDGIALRHSDVSCCTVKTLQVCSSGCRILLSFARNVFLQKNKTQQRREILGQVESPAHAVWLHVAENFIRKEEQMEGNVLMWHKRRLNDALFFCCTFLQNVVPFANFLWFIWKRLTFRMSDMRMHVSVHVRGNIQLWKLKNWCVSFGEVSINQWLSLVNGRPDTRGKKISSLPLHWSNQNLKLIIFSQHTPTADYLTHFCKKIKIRWRSVTRYVHPSFSDGFKTTASVKEPPEMNRLFSHRRVVIVT